MLNSKMISGYRAELDASDAVAQLVERRRPAHDAHHVGNNQQNPTGHSRLSRQTHLKHKKKKLECDSWNTQSMLLRRRDTDVEGELSREVVHAAGVHQTQSVPHRLGAQHTLACDWTEAAVGQSGRHDAGALTSHLDGTQLTGGARVDKKIRICCSENKWKLLSKFSKL